ncbi:FHA domain-containing protein isoform X1 [Glycine max]|uniref:FHA domain-containing protein n=1 Tax=Glycine max TaxID=3847 RepID=A0A0R0EIT8_SOYBN|nr:FHA domain-containing protein isoform X1 [Glycine max]|eukprot:XP_014627730.1 FHA domain-containing protein isoform X1 [Glycine max]
MESIFFQSLSLAKIPKSQTSPLLNSPLLFHSNATSVAFSSVPYHHHHLLKCFLFRSKANEKQNLVGVLRASEAATTPTTNDAERWLLEPVVSGVHARIQKKQGNLLVTDLDSTNGTFINDKRLRPGVVATISPGSCITFGDTHLAMFRVSKVEDVKPADTVGETEIELDTDNKSDDTETS